MDARDKPGHDELRAKKATSASTRSHNLTHFVRDFPQFVRILAPYAGATVSALPVKNSGESLRANVCT